MGNLLTEEVGNILTTLLGNVLTTKMGKVLDIYKREENRLIPCFPNPLFPAGSL